MPRSFAARLLHLWRCRAEYKLLERQRQTIATAISLIPILQKFQSNRSAWQQASPASCRC
jgi:hypothetical protein